MNKIIKQLNEAFNTGDVTFKQLDECVWIEDKYKTEIKILSDRNKKLKHNWNMLKSFLNEKIILLKGLSCSGDFIVEIEALKVAYTNVLQKMKSYENLEV